MGLLTSATESSQKSVLGRLFGNFSTKLSVLLFLGGLGYFGVNVWPAFNHDTYISEHALSPGVATDTFDLGKYVSEKLRELEKIVERTKERSKKNEIPVDWLYKEFLAARVEPFVQNFTVQYPLGLSPKYSGRNVFGVVRAPRGASNEAVVIATPYSRRKLPGVALLLALAKHSVEHVYWSKDLIFVITEKQELGMQAWLNGYHGRPDTKFLTAGEIAMQSGPIQAGICVELSAADGFTRTDISYNMINGQLPNLDLVNVAIRLADKYTRATIFEETENFVSYSWDGYKRLLATASRGIVQQATGPSSGLHQVFGQFNIEAITQRPKQGSHHGSVDIVQVGKMVEGLLRSVNNLLERFHQSFFFYILLSPYRYMSIGIYMPAVGAILLAALVKACALWIRLSADEEESDLVSKKESEVKEASPSTSSSSKKTKKQKKTKKNEPDAQNTNEGTEKGDESKDPVKEADLSSDSESKTDSPKQDEPKPPSMIKKFLSLGPKTPKNETDCTFSAVAPYFAASHLFGLLLRLAPDGVHFLMRQLNVGKVETTYITAVLGVVLVYSFGFPALMKAFSKSRGLVKPPSADLFRCLCLLELALAVGGISILNFGLSFILCLTWVPVFLLVVPNTNSFFKSIQVWLLVLVNPLVMLLLANFAMHVENWMDTVYLRLAAEETMGAISSMISSSYLYGNWLFSIATLVLYPIWIQFWALLYFKP